LTGLAELLQDNALCVVQGVGYPNPDQSHFRSMDIWQSASLEKNLTEGWVGKALKDLKNPKGVPAFLVKSGDRAPLALEGAPAGVPSINSLEEFQLQMAAASGADKKDQQAVIEGAAKGKGDGLLDVVKRTAENTYASSRRLQEIGKNYQPKVPYPNTPLAN